MELHGGFHHFPSSVRTFNLTYHCWYSFDHKAKALFVWVLHSIFFFTPTSTLYSLKEVIPSSPHMGACWGVQCAGDGAGPAQCWGAGLVVLADGSEVHWREKRGMTPAPRFLA